MAAEFIDPIECSSQPFSIDFSSSADVLAAGLITGVIELHSFQTPTNGKKSNTKSVIKTYDEGDGSMEAVSVQVSCRSVLHSYSGSTLFAGLSKGNTGSVCFIDSASGSIKSMVNEASEQGINKIFQVEGDQKEGGLVVTGDDTGWVKLWDERSAKKAVCEFKENTDFISDFKSSDDGNTLIATSGDATMSVFDLRKIGGKNDKKANKSRSDDQEDELLSCVIMKGSNKVVCGTQGGALAIWSWGKWLDQNDRFMGHPESVDALLKLDEDTLITGSSDGLVRVVEIQPNKLLGVLGNHDGFPVEDLQFSRDKRVIGSLSHDETVRMWDVGDLLEGDEGDDDEEAGEGMEVDAIEVMRSGGVGLGKRGEGGADEVDNSDSDWSDDMDDSDEEGGRKKKTAKDSDDSDDDSDSDDDDKSVGGKGRKKFKTENERFFEDL